MAEQAADSGSRRVPIGQHSVSIDEDVAYLEIQGGFVFPEVVEFHRQLEGIIRRHGRCFVIVDRRKMVGSYSAEMRRFVAEWNRSHRATSVVLIDDGLARRGGLSLIFAAIRLFRREELPLRIVGTEAAARAAIDEDRRRLSLSFT